MEKSPSSKYKIRFGDCDPFGHLNNSRYLDYLINAREDHLADHYKLDLNDFYKNNLAWVITSHEIAYVRSAVYNEVVTIQSSLMLAEADCLHLETVMMDVARTHVKAIMHTKLTHINTKTGRKEPHAEDFISWAKTVENSDIDIDMSLDGRVRVIREELNQMVREA